MELPPELWQMIADRIDDGKDIKSFMFTCQMFADCITEQMVQTGANPLWTLIIQFPDRSWNWEAISANHWTTFALVERYPDRNYNWEILVQRLIFPEEFLFGMIDLLSDFSVQDEYDYQINLMYIKVMENLEFLGYNRHLPERFLQEYWKIFDNCLSATTPYSMLCKLAESTDFQICYTHVCSNETVPMDTLQDNDVIDFARLSGNESITFEVFESHLYGDWDFESLSMNPSVTVEFLELAPDEDWHWEFLADSPDIVRMFRRFPNEDWCYDSISCNKHLTLDLLLEFPNRPWNMFHISSTINVSFDAVRKTPQLHWEYTGLLCNNHVSTSEILQEFTMLDNGIIIHNSMCNSGMHQHLSMLSYEAACEMDSTSLYGPQCFLSYRDVPWSDVVSNPGIDWDYESMSYNPNIPWTYISRNPELFDTQAISYNHFNHPDTKKQLNLIRRHNVEPAIEGPVQEL